MQQRFRRSLLLHAGIAAASVCSIAAPVQAQLSYTTLDFGTTGTFLTGIRGNNVVGNYVVPGTSNTGGLLYSLSTGTWTAFPVATPNGANFPGALASSPYGPSFGAQSGILRVVGSYKTQSSSPYNLGYLYDGVLAPGGTLTTLVYPGTSSAPTLETIVHSTFGNQAVGNYDTRLATGNAFIYTIDTGTYATNNFPGAVSTTAYGIWGNKIAGGYAPPGLGFERGYIYDQGTGVWTSYNHPGAIFTHFEGITGGGRAGAYNLVADWAGPDGNLHASVLHIGADGNQTWIELAVPGASLTSANSIYGNQAIGIYVDANGLTNGYLVSIPGIYDPIRNIGVLNTSAPNVPALSGGDGDDLVNDGAIRTIAINSTGIRSGAFAIVSNNGSITVAGAGSAGIEMNGAFGTLLNSGSIVAAVGADAIRTGSLGIGSTVINNGIIDGRIAITPPSGDARFENSGWLGISAPGAGIVHVIGGRFVQTSTGTLVLRIAPGSNDALQVSGAAILGGTLAPQLTGSGTSGIALPIGQQYRLITAQGGIGGSFTGLTQPAALPSGTRFDALYAPTTLDLVVTPSSYGNLAFAGLPESANQSAVGNALDAARPAAGVAMTTTQSAIYAPLYTLSGSAVAPALEQLAPTIYGDALMVGRDNWYLVAGAISEQLAARRGLRHTDNAQTASGPGGSTVWLTGLGQFGDVHSNGTAGYSSSTGGVATGIDVPLTPGLTVGAALGFAHQSTSAENSASFSGDALQFELYGSFRQGIAFLEAQAGGSFFEGTATRPLAAYGVQAKGNANGAAGGGALRAGVRLEAAEWQIEPGISLAGVGLSQGSLTETQAGPVGLSVGNASVGSLQTLLGVRVERRIALSETVTLVPSAQIGWLHEYLDTQGTIRAAFIGAPGAAFGVRSAPVGRDAAVIGLRASLEMNGPVSVYAGYSGALNGSSTVQTVAAGLRFVW
jgi:subtilase-type serine protease